MPRPDLKGLGASARSARSARCRTLVYLLALVLCALALRLALLIRSDWLLEGDDSLSALMALGILEGDRPIMLKNQTYAAAWQPYAMATSFTLFEVSRVAAKLPTLIESLAFLGTTWLLAREVAGPMAARFAALFAALPPIYVLVLSLKPWAPYLEVTLFGSLALWCATRLAFRQSRVAANQLAVGCGLAGGLAFWMHPLAVYYLLPSALVLLLRIRGRALARVTLLGLGGFVVGVLPVWIYNLQTSGATLRFILSGSGGQTAERTSVLAAWWSSDLPRGAGLWHPWGPTSTTLSAILAGLLLTAVGWAVFSCRGKRPSLRPLDGVLLTLAAIPLLFVVSGFGGPALNPWGFDATGRYVLPIWAGLAVVLGAFLATIWHWHRTVAMALAAIALTCNLYGSATTAPVLAFQSPYWTKLPVDNAPLLETLQAERVSHVWMNHWAAFPLMFDARAAGKHLVAYDWYDVQAGGIDRFPEYLAPVEQAERPAFVLVTHEEESELERRLRELGVTYLTRRVPPYLIAIPTSRKVHPSEVTAALDYRY